MPTYDEEVVEAATATDAASTALVSPQMVEEFGAAADAQSVAAAYAVAVIEGAAAVDVQTGVGVFAKTVAETLTALDTVTSVKRAPGTAVCLLGRIYGTGPAVVGLMSNDPVAVTGAIT